MITHRSVPTDNEILVPETLLKKRKSQEKQREERSAELEKKKKVMPSLFSLWTTYTRVNDDDDTSTCVTRPSGQWCCIY